MEIIIPNNQPKRPEILTNGINVKTENKLYEIEKLLLGKNSTKNCPPTNRIRNM